MWLRSALFCCCFLVAFATVSVKKSNMKGVVSLMMRVTHCDWMKVNLASDNIDSLDKFSASVDYEEIDYDSYFTPRLEGRIFKGQRSINLELPASKKFDFLHDHSNDSIKMRTSIRIKNFSSSEENGWQENQLNDMAYECRCRHPKTNRVCVDYDTLKVSIEADPADMDDFVKYCQHVNYSSIQSKRNHAAPHELLLSKLYEMDKFPIYSVSLIGGVFNEKLIIDFLQKHLSSLRELSFQNCLFYSDSADLLASHMIKMEKLSRFILKGNPEMKQATLKLVQSLWQNRSLEFLELRNLGLVDSDLDAKKPASYHIEINLDNNYLTSSFFKKLGSQVFFDDPFQYNNNKVLSRLGLSNHANYCASNEYKEYGSPSSTPQETLFYFEAILANNRKLKIELVFAPRNIGIRSFSYMDHSQAFEMNFNIFGRDGEKGSISLILPQTDRLHLNLERFVSISKDDVQVRIPFIFKTTIISLVSKE